jgi:HTH-type transcriptional regulator/antitoxin HigA
MSIRRPAEVYPPGEFLREEIEARGWTQADLADILGCLPEQVDEIIKGKCGISPATARALAEALGTSPELWLNLDATYQRAQMPADGTTRLGEADSRARRRGARR